MWNRCATLDYSEVQIETTAQALGGLSTAGILFRSRFTISPIVCNTIPKAQQYDAPLNVLMGFCEKGMRG